MAFFSKVGGILRQTASKNLNHEIAASRLSIFQGIRCMSSSKVFVGGLSYSTDDGSLNDAFSKYGDVAEARVIVDRESGRSRGFGFVTYATPDAASAAIQALDGQELHGRRIRVNYANDRTRGYGGGFGGYGGGGNPYGGQGNFGSYSSGGAGAYESGGGNSYGGSGGNYGNYATGGGGGYASGGNYPSGGDSYDSSSTGNFGNYTTGGGGGYASGGGNFASGGYNAFSNESSGGDQVASGHSSNMDGTGAGYNHQDPVDTDLRDDNEPSDYADRRA